MKKGIGLFLLLLLAASTRAQADITSTNYQMNADFSGSASANLTGTNYAVNDSSIEWVGLDSVTASSSNYTLTQNGAMNGYSPDVTITSVTPGNYARFFTDQSTSFTVSAVSADGDTLSYQAKQDGTLKDGPKSSNVLGWALSNSDKGRRELNLMVTDSEGIVSQDISMYAYRRPVK